MSKHSEDAFGSDQEWRVAMVESGQDLDNPRGWTVYRGAKRLRFEPNPDFVRRYYRDLSAELGNFEPYWVEVVA